MHVESKATADVSARSRVIPVLTETRSLPQSSADQQAESRIFGVPSTEDVEQATHVESQMANEEVTSDVAGSTHTSQSSEGSLVHGLNNGALEQMDISQPVQVTDQAVEESVSVMNSVQSEGSEDLEKAG
ncbi:hypothetical protein V6N12_011809 [Hibiscus sabdariffa]|uniref:Uncharacterized protein n=1 Tax=Hibiscus sabdariffa TaxID=183260 RepID=A0ABR2BUY7_9ROSI